MKMKQSMQRPAWSVAGCVGVLLVAMSWWGAAAQDDLPWKSKSGGDYDVYREVPPEQSYSGGGSPNERYEPPRYVPPRVQYNDGAYNGGSDGPQNGTSGYSAPQSYDRADYDRYQAPGSNSGSYYDGGGLPPDPVVREDNGSPGGPGTYSEDEILGAGHRFFGSISQGLAKVVQKAFREQGQPNGYILGEDAGGAFVAGLRYGEGTLYTRDAGTYKVYWQGPTIGYDFGAEGSKTMVLVYNLRSPAEIYRRFGGVQGSAYIVGGVGLQFMQRDHVTLAPIRSGVGLRLGANVGYLKYTRSPTWNPF